MGGPRLNATDRIIVIIDQGLRSVLGASTHTGRPNPAEGIAEPQLSDGERTRVAALMRVNHAGEVAAQGLYHGQALTARGSPLRRSLERAAEEEGDHLQWCERRLTELSARKSLLGPLWYAGAFGIGALAGLAGDRWNLAFLAETERQVTTHLQRHLALLPDEDRKTRLVLEQMRADESRHARTASRAGGRELPGAARRLMQLASRVMTTVAYRW